MSTQELTQKQTDRRTKEKFTTPVDRRVNRKRQERIDKLRDVYQRVQSRDADPAEALRDVQDAVLVLLEEFTHTVYNGG